ncbi:hypothetical protein ACIRJS_29680 [Streptomyces sp. NPDC102340]|uniref:hypothetical protein n=1 Tax=unclassified Streptomyces TaxID=2593676 RepID=UPI0038297D08
MQRKYNVNRHAAWQASGGHDLGQQHIVDQVVDEHAALDISYAMSRGLLEPTGLAGRMSATLFRSPWDRPTLAPRRGIGLTPMPRAPCPRVMTTEAGWSRITDNAAPASALRT